MTKMTVGAYCQETAYSSSQFSKNQVSEFQSHVSSNTADFLFFKYDSKNSSADSHSGTYENGVTYTFSDIFCFGEVVDTAVCGGLTGKNNNPQAVSYELFSIFEVGTVANRLSASTNAAVDTFFVDLYKSLKDCGDQHCSWGGTCRLNADIWSDSFVNDWDGDFSKLWDMNEDGDAYCFCHPDRTGESCEFGIACDDDESCASGYNCIKTTDVSMCIAQGQDISVWICDPNTQPCPSGYDCIMTAVPAPGINSWCKTH